MALFFSYLESAAISTLEQQSVRFNVENFSLSTLPLSLFFSYISDRLTFEQAPMNFLTLLWCFHFSQAETIEPLEALLSASVSSLPRSGRNSMQEPLSS